MGDTFIFVKFLEETINNQKFISICLLDFDKFVPIKIYKKDTDSLRNLLSSFSSFEDVSSFITYDIKTDRKTGKSKVVLDIKF